MSRSIECMVKEFSEITKKIQEFRGVYDVRNINRYVDCQVKIWKELCKQGDKGKESLAVLLLDADPVVRFEAAIHLLNYKTVEAIAVLEEFASLSGSLGGNARAVLSSWQRGQWSIDEKDSSCEGEYYSNVNEVFLDVPYSEDLKQIMTSSIPTSPSALNKVFKDSGIKHRACLVSKLACTSISILPQQITQSYIGMSKIGGHPDMPADVIWPTRKDTPLSFIAQFNLGELRDTLGKTVMPIDSGMLYFFYDMYEMPYGDQLEDCNAGIVLYSKNSNIVHTIPPEELSQEYIIPSCGMLLHEQISLPSAQSMLLRTLGFSDDELHEYSRIYDELYSLQSPNDEPYEPFCRLLGYPTLIQEDDIFTNCQLATRDFSTNTEIRNSMYTDTCISAQYWRLLLQVNSWPESIQVQDNGSIYYCIRDDDFYRKRFDNIWTVMQTS